MDNFNYYPKGIIMKDGKISEESQNESEATKNTRSFNLNSPFANKSLNELLPLLLGGNFNKNEMLSQIMNNIQTKEKPKEKINKKQNYIDEM